MLFQRCCFPEPFFLSMLVWTERRPWSCMDMAIGTMPCGCREQANSRLEEHDTARRSGHADAERGGAAGQPGSRLSAARHADAAADPGVHPAGYRSRLTSCHVSARCYPPDSPGSPSLHATHFGNPWRKVPINDSVQPGPGVRIKPRRTRPSRPPLCGSRQHLHP